MIITISGKQGAGKTTLAKNLAKELNLEFISIGNLKGIMAQERKMTIDKFAKMGEKNPGLVHKLADKKTMELGKTRKDFIIEGWIAWHFIPSSIKIFLDVQENVGAKRIYKDQRHDETPCKTIQEMINLLSERLKITNEQFIKFYGVKFLDKNHYDIILDTTNLSIEEVKNKILKKIKCPTF